MKKFLMLIIILLSFAAAPAFADSFYVLGGYVAPRGESDVFFQNELETDFQSDDLNSFAATLGYDYFHGDMLNLGASITFFEADQEVEDVDFVFEDGSPVLRTIGLRMVPLEFNIRFLPMGRESGVIPYFGGGPGIYVWKYEEFGDFVFDRNSSDPTVVTGLAESDGVDFGWHIEGGVQFPVSRSATIVGEYKYWSAEGDLDRSGFDPDFDPIDLSGSMISGGISFWF